MQECPATLRSAKDEGQQNFLAVQRSFYEQTESFHRSAVCGLRSAVIFTVALGIHSAHSAQVDSSELSQIATQAQKNGAAAVSVHMLPLSLDELGSDFKGAQARIAQRKNLLLAELGPNAWDGGRWDNQMGQIGLHVSPAGLIILQRSANAVSFTADRPWTAYTKLSGLDGSHDEINRLLDSQGFVDAAITLNVDGLAFDTAKDGRVRLQSSAQSIDEGRSLARTLLGEMTERQLPAKTAALAALTTMTAPTLTLRVSREGVLKLAQSDLVRSLKPAGFKDPRPLSIGADVLAVAQTNGTARVIITIRTPMMGGNVSKASFAAQTQAHKRALDDALATTGQRNRSQDADISTLGATAAHLTYAQLMALKNSGDARLLAIELNRPVASPSLVNSTQLMNMPAAWANPNFRGAGQNIVVMDTGVQRDHEFFKDAAGNSRVFFEACFGTNQAQIGSSPATSTCPQQDANGDSPGGLPGSASPCGGLSTNGECSHGTHVTGIAAGRASAALPTGLQGVAPDARIAAFQVMSLVNGFPGTFAEDLALAMQRLVSVMTPGTTNNPFVVNLSLGGYLFTSACPNFSPSPVDPVVQPLSNSIGMLKNVGVPVIAATGNEGRSESIAWPACVPNVIKVSSVINDSTGTTRHPGANLANPTQFPNEQFWLAPGGRVSSSPVIGSGIQSSIFSSSSTVQTGIFVGTSMAAPHVAGLYAALKAIAPSLGVDGISNYINSNASVPVTADVACTGSTTTLCPTTFRRPRWPGP